MWTPRRILLLIGAALGLAAVYLGYSQILGGIDGLPELPMAYRIGSHEPPPPPPGVSPTVRRLIRAFGPNSPEANDNLVYKVRIESRDKGIVFACGQPGFAPPSESSPFVNVAPVSVVFYGKPELNLPPGQSEAMSTLHAESARLEYDRPVASLQDMDGAKLVAMTLQTNPNVPSTDPRRGFVELTDNQRSLDTKDMLVVRTPGPLLYRDPEAGLPPGATADEVPHITTPATIEVVDRRNLPKNIGLDGVATGVLSGDDLRKPGEVADILAGKVLPPPTVTATGLKIFLTPNSKNPKPGEKRSPAGFTGVRRMELGSKVQFNLWSDGGGGFPGAGGSAAAKVVAKIERPVVLGAALGGLAEGGLAARLMAGKALVVIETLGGFRYDIATGLAEFETAATAANVANHVAVSRLTPGDKTDSVLCEKLQIELATAADRADPKPKPDDDSGPKIKGLTATGPYVVVSVEAEGLVAQGTKLVYKNDAKSRTSTTVLSGPQVAASRDRNKLIAGGRVPGTITITTIEPPPDADPKSLAARKKTSVLVDGPGSAELLDAESGKHTSRASWTKSLTQDRVLENGEEVDLLKFVGDAEFADTKADMTLGGDRLFLWLAGRDTKAKASPDSPVATGAKPKRLDAVGHVRVKSPELVIRETNQLNLLFTETTTPTKPQRRLTMRNEPGLMHVVAQLPAVEPVPGVPPPAAASAPAAPPKPKPPVVLSARTIDATLARYPVAATAPLAGAKPPRPGTPPPAPKYAYELDRALCVGRVVAHQDPADPKKAVRGLDIRGERLTMKGERVNGESLQAMTVTGTKDDIAQVFFESLQLFGPYVNIDQARNSVAVDGLGTLVMPANQDTTGNATGKQNELVVNWTKRMRFDGALATAEFLGSVDALQQPARPGLMPPATETGDGSWTKSRMYAHRLDVLFDKPVYFNQMRRETAPGAKPEPGPKLKKASGIPMPDDEIALLKKSGGDAPRAVTYQDEVHNKANALLKAQRIVASELEVAIADRQQNIVASGPGEVRILQPDTGGGGFGQPARPVAPGQRPPYKLTVAKFDSRMTGVDKGKLFQQAVFANGARVWTIPTNDINLAFAEHATPAGTMFISAEDSLEVSSSRTAVDAEVDQRMTAVGNGEFRDDLYEGTAATIRYEGTRVVFEAGEGTGRFVVFNKRQRAINNPPGFRAKTLTYYKDGTVNADGVAGGLFIQ